MTDPRRTSLYKTKRLEFLRRSAKVCHWCGCPVSMQLPKAHPLNATVDHLIEVDRAPYLAMDVSNWVVACRRCNSKRGAMYGNAKHARRTASREW